MTYKASIFAVALLASCVCGAAFAQDAGETAPGQAELHQALHLAPPQEDAWRRYQDAVQPDPFVDARHRAAQAMAPSLPTPRRVDLIAADMQADVDRFRQLGAAVKAFYAVLTPDQQRIFDRQTQPRGGPRPGEPPD